MKPSLRLRPRLNKLIFENLSDFTGLKATRDIFKTVTGISEDDASKRPRELSQLSSKPRFSPNCLYFGQSDIVCNLEQLPRTQTSLCLKKNNNKTMGAQESKATLALRGRHQSLSRRRLLEHCISSDNQAPKGFISLLIIPLNCKDTLVTNISNKYRGTLIRCCFSSTLSYLHMYPFKFKLLEIVSRSPTESRDRICNY